MDRPVRPQSGRKPVLGKWVWLALLAAFAGLMYAAIIVKASRYGLNLP